MPDTPAEIDRLDRIEKQLADVRRRLEALERFVASKPGNQLDRAAVREKVVFDWQS
jgi:hypothetical protein